MAMKSKPTLLATAKECILTVSGTMRRNYRSRYWWPLLAFLFVPQFETNAASIITAASPSAHDVQTAVNLANDGDTVIVPAGSATWTTEVTVTKAITLQGAGINTNTITSTLNPALWVNSDNHGETRITGFTFNGGDAATEGPVVLTGNEVRMDHCLFTNCALWCAMSSDGFGVIDHCIFKEMDGGLQIRNPNYGGGSSGYGDGSWTNGDNWGTTNFMYIENCQFYGIGQVGAIDGCWGARWVFRYNYVTNDILDSHGTETTGRPRGTRAVEIYDNTLVGGSDFAEAFELRSGSAVIFSNTATKYNGNIVALKNFRSPSCNRPGTYPPWGLCEYGTNVYDGNTDTNGYPAIDQCGRGSGLLMQDSSPGNGIPVLASTGKPGYPQEASDPIYEWGNTVNGADAHVGTCSALFVEGRDYFTDIAKPNYTPLVYPHPLVSGVAVSPPTFTLTVVNGTGSGSYTNNAMINITAYATTNQSFAYWTGPNIANTNRASTMITMPNSNLTVTAEYAPFPPPALQANPP